MTVVRRLGLLALAALAIVAAVVLWGVRPPLPQPARLAHVAGQPRARAARRRRGRMAGTARAPGQRRHACDERRPPPTASRDARDRARPSAATAARAERARNAAAALRGGTEQAAASGGFAVSQARLERPGCRRRCRIRGCRGRWRGRRRQAAGAWRARRAARAVRARRRAAAETVLDPRADRLPRPAPRRRDARPTARSALARHRSAPQPAAPVAGDQRGQKDARRRLHLRRRPLPPRPRPGRRRPRRAGAAATRAPMPPSAPPTVRGCSAAPTRLWRGTLLDGTERDWAEGHQRRLRGERVELLHRLAETWLELREPRRALDAAERGIALDELHEPCWRAALDAEAQLGQRDAVEARYDALVRLLDDRLGPGRSPRRPPSTERCWRPLPPRPARARTRPARRPGAGRASSETRGR